MINLQKLNLERIKFLAKKLLEKEKSETSIGDILDKISPKSLNDLRCMTSQDMEKINKIAELFRLCGEIDGDILS